MIRRASRGGAARFHIVHLQREGTGDDLESLVFLAKDGKRLQQGQRVRISPTTTKQQRHGGIEGEIVKVRLLPVRDNAIAKRLGVRSLLESVRGTCRSH